MPLSSPKHSGSAGPPGSSGRFCFFAADKGEQFIHFSGLDLLRLRRFRQVAHILFYPDRDRTMLDPQVPCDASKIHAIHIQSNRLPAHFRFIAVMFLLGRVLATTHHTAIALAARWSSSRSILSLDAIALR